MSRARWETGAGPALTPQPSLPKGLDHRDQHEHATTSVIPSLSLFPHFTNGEWEWAGEAPKSCSALPFSCWRRERCHQLSHSEMFPDQGRHWPTVRLMASLWGPAHLEAKNVAPPGGSYQARAPPGVSYRSPPPSSQLKNRRAWRRFPRLFKAFCCPCEAGWAELLWRACGVSL